MRGARISHSDPFTSHPLCLTCLSYGLTSLRIAQKLREGGLIVDTAFVVLP